MEIKNNLLKVTFSLALAVLFLSCQKEDTGSTSINLPVVESYLTPGHPIIVKISQQKSLTDTAQYGNPITGLQVFVSNGTTNAQLAETSAGSYSYTDLNFLVTGKTYTLQFKYQSLTVSAKTIIPAKPVNFVTQYDTVSIGSSGLSDISTIDRLSWDNPGLLNHVLVFDCLDGSVFPASVNSFNATVNTSFEENTNAASYYNLNQKTFPYLGNYLVTLLSVNQEYINLMTSSTNNATSQNLSNVPTNIVNGFGIFTAIQADTLKMDVNP
jgi:hypothetical protein